MLVFAMRSLEVLPDGVAQRPQTQDLQPAPRANIQWRQQSIRSNTTLRQRTTRFRFRRVLLDHEPIWPSGRLPSDAGPQASDLSNSTIMKNQIQLDTLETEIAPCGMADPTAAIIVVIIIILLR